MIKTDGIFSTSEQEANANAMLFCLYFISPIAYFSTDISFYDSVLLGVQCFGALLALKLLYKFIKS
jgi:hypothetical protein